MPVNETAQRSIEPFGRAVVSRAARDACCDRPSGGAADRCGGGAAPCASDRCDRRRERCIARSGARQPSGRRAEPSHRCRPPTEAFRMARGVRAYERRLIRLPPDPYVGRAGEVRAMRSGVKRADASRSAAAWSAPPAPERRGTTRDPDASCRAVPPRRCSIPPRTANRALVQSGYGVMHITATACNGSVSAPFRRIEFPRQANASPGASER